MLESSVGTILKDSEIPDEFKPAFARFDLMFEGLRTRVLQTLLNVVPQNEPDEAGIAPEDQKAFWLGLLHTIECKPEKLLLPLMKVALADLEESVDELDQDGQLEPLPVWQSYLQGCS